jgi:DNA invertase Pin-like site-specific DNA recombinase
LSERVVAGLRRAKREGRTLGRPKVIVDREKLRAAREAGKSLRQIGEQFGISRTLVMNLLSLAVVLNSPEGPWAILQPQSLRPCFGLFKFARGY